MLPFTRCREATKMPSILRKYHCRSLDMTIRFDAKDFQVTKFRKATATPKFQRYFATTCGSKKKNGDDHAHIFLELDRDGEESTLQFTFGRGKSEEPDTSEPYFEDVPMWFAPFLVPGEEYKTRFVVTFEFDENKYEPVLPLGYPLLLNNKLFENTKVGGFEITFPPESSVGTTILTKGAGVWAVLMYANLSVNLADFDIKKSLTAFLNYPNALMREREVGQNARQRKKTIRNK